MEVPSESSGEFDFGAGLQNISFFFLGPIFFFAFLFILSLSHTHNILLWGRPAESLIYHGSSICFIFLYLLIYQLSSPSFYKLQGGEEANTVIMDHGSPLDAPHNHTSLVKVIIWMLSATATLCVIVRFWTKWSLTRTWTIDDSFISVAWVSLRYMDSI